MAKISLFEGRPVNTNVQLNPGLPAQLAQSVGNIADAGRMEAAMMQERAAKGDPVVNGLLKFAKNFSEAHDQALAQSNKVNEELDAFNKIRGGEKQYSDGIKDLSSAGPVKGPAAVYKVRDQYVNDTKKIADNVIKDIYDPEAKDAVKQDFAQFQEAGAQQVEQKARTFAQAEQEQLFYNNLDELSKTATENGIDGLGQAQEILGRSLNNALSAGLISQDKAVSLQDKVGKRIVKDLVSKALMDNPQGVVEDIAAGRYNQLTEEERLSVRSRAKAILTDQVVANKITTDKADTANRDRITAVATELEFKIKDGQMNRAELDGYREQLGDSVYHKLNTQYNNVVLQETKKARERLLISDKISRNESLADVAPAKIEQHFNETLAAQQRTMMETAKAQGVEPVGPIQMAASVASRYPTPIKSVQTMVEHAFLRGNEKQQMDAYNAVKMLKSYDKEATLTTMPKAAQETFDIVDGLITYGGRTPQEAFQEVTSSRNALKDPVAQEHVKKAWKESLVNSEDFNMNEFVVSNIMDKDNTPVINPFGPSSTDSAPPTVDKNVRDWASREYQRQFLKYGTDSAAEAAVKGMLTKTAGVSSIGNVPRVMLYPPERVTNISAEHAKEYLNDYLDNNADLEKLGSDRQNVFLQITDSSAGEIANGGRKPKYHLMYNLNGDPELPMPVFGKDGSMAFIEVTPENWKKYVSDPRTAGIKAGDAAKKASESNVAWDFKFK